MKYSSQSGSVKISQKELIHSINFLVKTDEKVFVEVPMLGEMLRMTVIFKKGEDSAEASGRWNFDNGVMNFEFLGWNNSLGSCILEPTKFGELAGGKKIYFQMTHHLVANNNLVNLYLLIDA